MITVLSKKDFLSLDQTNLRFAEKNDVKSHLIRASHLRALHRDQNNGYSKDKNWRDLGGVPFSIRNSAWYRKMFPDDLNPDELFKRRLSFFKSNKNLAHVDKI